MQGLGLVDGVLGDRARRLRGSNARRLDRRVGLLDGVREERLVQLLHEHGQPRGGARLGCEAGGLGGGGGLVDRGGQAVVAAALSMRGEERASKRGQSEVRADGGARRTERRRRKWKEQ